MEIASAKKGLVMVVGKSTSVREILVKHGWTAIDVSTSETMVSKIKKLIRRIVHGKHK